jgi:hypothetical protein
LFRLSLLQIARLHHEDSEALLDSFVPLQDDPNTTEVFLSVLRDPKLRALIPPAVFFKWSSAIDPVEVEEVESLKLYASERRADFNETQRAEFDRKVEYWQKTSDAKSMEQKRRRRDQIKLNREQQRIRRMQGD